MSVESVEVPVEETEAKPVKVAKQPTPCACSLYSVEVPDGDSTALEGVDCDAVSKGRFAPGHDAKLKSLLIKAGANGHKVYRANENGEDVLTTWQDAANEHGFGPKVHSGVELAQKRAGEKAEREAKRAELKAQRAVEREAKQAAAKAAKEAASTTESESSDDESMF
jgi:hypothetical protein